MNRVPVLWCTLLLFFAACRSIHPLAEFNSIECATYCEFSNDQLGLRGNFFGDYLIDSVADMPMCDTLALLSSRMDDTATFYDSGDLLATAHTLLSPFYRAGIYVIPKERTAGSDLMLRGFLFIPDTAMTMYYKQHVSNGVSAIAMVREFREQWLVLFGYEYLQDPSDTFARTRITREFRAIAESFTLNTP